jgi:uncharacterized protein YehS (DUF1456 family)
MNHNDIIRRLRFALSYSDLTLREIFRLAGQEIDQPTLAAIMKKEADPGFRECSTAELEKFLDGLIIYRRGPKDNKPTPPPQPGPTLTNNEILKKLRIALELREEDMLGILAKGGATLSPHELSALFRRPGHRRFKECGSQYLRYFLKGLSRKTWRP